MAVLSSIHKVRWCSSFSLQKVLIRLLNTEQRFFLTMTNFMVSYNITHCHLHPGRHKEQRKTWTVNQWIASLPRPIQWLGLQSKMSLIKGNTALQTHEISTKHLCNTETAIKTHWNSTSASYSQIKISNRKSKNSLICFKFVQRFHLPTQARLFTCDAISMYTNIDSSHGLIIIQPWLDEYKEELPTDFPTSLFLKILVS